jgi:periplasmic protein TonB
MALSDLRVSGLEHYGGVELKRSYRKYFSEGIAVSIGLHVLVLLLYTAYHYLTIEPHYIYPIWRTTSLLVTIPPPSITNDDPLPAATSVNSRAALPYDIPVPVPRMLDPVELEPILVADPATLPGTTIGPATSSTPSDPRPELVVKPQASQSSIVPDKTVWIDVSEEPRPIQDVQKIVIYPMNAQRTGIEGSVTLSALIGEDGRVLQVDIDKHAHPWLDQAAVEAMMKMRFTPALQGKEPVKVWYTQTIQFKLNN